MKFIDALFSTDDGFNFAHQTARAEVFKKMRQAALSVAKTVMESDLSIAEKLACIEEIKAATTEGFEI